VDGDGVPIACAVTAANVNDTLVFERLFLSAFAIMAHIQTMFADKGYDAEHHRNLCRRFGAKPHIHKRSWFLQSRIFRTWKPARSINAGR
jgi:transposase